MTHSLDNVPRTPILGCIADDVTGATDLATNLVKGGMRVVQIFGMPDKHALQNTTGADAIVVALKTRSVAKDRAIDESLQTLRSLQKMGITLFYFKYCSTFDSTAEGNIGPVAEALMSELGVEQTIFCPAFPDAGRTVCDGLLFVGDKLLHESGMQNHPINPMTDANLERVLRQQTTRNIGNIRHESYDHGASFVTEQMASLLSKNVSLMITDALNGDHLATLAQAVCQMPLLTGGSGLAGYLPHQYRRLGLLDAAEFTATIPQVFGRTLIIAGSCSTATIAQVNHIAKHHPVFQVDVEAIVEKLDTELERLRNWATANEGQTLVVASAAFPNVVKEMQRRFGVTRVAVAVESFLAAAALMMVKDFEARRLVLAGGETSGAVASALGVKMLNIGPEICTGVPWTETVGDEPRLAIAFKSGNFGDEVFFETAMKMLP